MKLYIKDTIRRLRTAKGMTQEQLADALGVAFQSVSRWENGTNYPDVELIPEIAIYFGVSTDELLGMSGAIKAEKLREAWKDYYAATDKSERLAILREMHRNFPEDIEILSFLASVLSDFPELYEEQKAMTEQFIAAAPGAQEFTEKRNEENDLIYLLFGCAPDEDLQNLLDKYSSENYDMTRAALLNYRYFYRNEWEGYELTRQMKLKEMLFDIFEERLRKNYHASAADSAWAQQKSLQILNILTDYHGVPLVNPAPDLWFEPKCLLGFRLSCALASSDRKEEALTVLEDTVTLIENYSTLPVGSKLTYECPSLDSFRYEVIPFDENNEEPYTTGIPLKHMAYKRNGAFMQELTVSVSIHPLVAEEGWEWFDPIRDDPRFLSCLKRVKNLAVTDADNKA